MKLNKSDLSILYTRGSGPGGQHKNKVETCVTVTHIPTGISERCQDSRSKIKNCDTAIRRVTNRVMKLESDKKHEKINDIRKDQILDSKRIRTYNYARNIVTDHITGKKADLKKVLNGELDLLKF